jgi:hypothetical protein
VSQSALKRGLAALLALAAVVSGAQGLRNALSPAAGGFDFQWSSSRAVLQGVDPYAAHQRGDHSHRILAQYPNYPVSGLILLWPYAALEWPTARLLWALTNLVLTIVCVWLLTGPLARTRADEPPTGSRARPLASWNGHSWILLALLVCSF